MRWGKNLSLWLRAMRKGASSSVGPPSDDKFRRLRVKIEERVGVWRPAAKLKTTERAEYLLRDGKCAESVSVPKNHETELLFLHYANGEHGAGGTGSFFSRSGPIQNIFLYPARRCPVGHTA